MRLDFMCIDIAAPNRTIILVSQLHARLALALVRGLDHVSAQREQAIVLSFLSPVIAVEGLRACER